jgi:hypothetical protein
MTIPVADDIVTLCEALAAQAIAIETLAAEVRALRALVGRVTVNLGRPVDFERRHEARAWGLMNDHR